MKNIYIRAMEIGFENPDGKIYADIRDELALYLGDKLSPFAEYSLLEWITTAFNCIDYAKG